MSGSLPDFSEEHFWSSNYRIIPPSLDQSNEQLVVTRWSIKGNSAGLWSLCLCHVNVTYSVNAHIHSNNSVWYFWLLRDSRGSWGATGGCWCCRCRPRGRRRGWLGWVRGGRARAGHRLAWPAGTHTAGSHCCCYCCCSRPVAAGERERGRESGGRI